MWMRMEEGVVVKEVVDEGVGTRRRRWMQRW